MKSILKGDTGSPVPWDDLVELVLRVGLPEAFRPKTTRPGALEIAVTTTCPRPKEHTTHAA